MVQVCGTRRSYLLLLFFALVKKIMSESPESGLKPAFVAYLIFGLTLLVINMPNFAISLEGFRANYQYMLAFFIGYYIVYDKQEWISALRLILAVGLLIALYGLLQPLLGVQMPAGWVDAGESARFRAFSIVQSPNVLGSYMALLNSSGDRALFCGNRSEMENSLAGGGAYLSHMPLGYPI